MIITWRQIRAVKEMWKTFKPQVLHCLRRWGRCMETSLSLCSKTVLFLTTFLFFWCQFQLTVSLKAQHSTLYWSLFIRIPEIHQNRILNVPKDQQDFFGRGLSFEFLLYWRILVFTLHGLSFAFWYTVVDLCLVASDNPLQNTRIFITSQDLGRKLHVLLLVQISNLFGNPSYANFTLPHVIIHYGMCGSTTDT